MAVNVVHTKVSSISDDPSVAAAGGIVPSDWNASHSFTMASGFLLGRSTAGVGSAEEITVGSGLSLSGGTLSASGAGVSSFSAGSTGFSPSTGTTGAITLSGTLNVANGGTGVTTSTGSGSVVLSSSPTLVTPALGTPSSATLTNATGLPVSTGISGLGTGVATALAVNTGTAGAFLVNGGALGTPSSATLTNATGLPVSTGISGLGTGVATALAVNTSSAGAFVVNGGALGTPSSGTLTNATGLPVSTGISGLGTGIATFLGTPSSSNLAAAVTDETGSGALVFATNPTLTTPNLGVPSAVTLTNATGLPVSTGINGLGTGVATALAVNTGTAGAFVVNGGALGTPSSGTLTNATGLPVSTGISGLGTGVATALAVNTGTAGAVVLYDGALGTPSSGTLTNATGLPVSTGISGLGTGVATALAVNTGTAGAFVVNGGALGTPSSGTVTNLTGTASININGTVGATTPATGAFTTLSSTGNTTLGDASSDTVTINGTVQPDVLISGSSSGNALRITQTGTGNALLVEDSASTDSTPFIITADGRVGMGVPNASYFPGNIGLYITANDGNYRILFQRVSDDSSGPQFYFRKARGTIDARTAVQSGDRLGTISFSGLIDVTNQYDAASIFAEVDGTPGTNDMPGRLIFNTTADGASSPTERMRINNAGSVGIGGTPTVDLLRLTGTASGGTTINGLTIDQTVGSGITANYRSILSRPILQNATFTLTNLYHFYANPQTKPAAATLSNQYGFFSESTLTDATTNFGFYSNIASAANRWNFYAAGTAANYFAGNTFIGATTGDQALNVNGAVRVSAITSANQTSAGTMDFTGGNLRFLVWGSAGVQGTIQWWTAPGGSGATQRMILTGSNNLGLATATFGTNATNTFSIASGTAPASGVADTVQYYSMDLSAGNTMPAFYTEGTNVGTGTPTANRTIAVNFNGTTYYLLASTTA